MKFDSAWDEHLLIDPVTGNVLEVNSRFEEVSGYPLEEVAGRPWEDLLLGLDAFAIEQVRHELDREGIVNFDCRKARMGNAPYPVRVQVRLGLHNGKLTYFAVFRDLTAEHQVREAVTILSSDYGEQCGEHRSERGIERLAKWLDIDYFLVASVTDPEASRLDVITLFCRDELEGDIADIDDHSPYRLALQGELVCARSDAARAMGGDRFLEANSIESYFCLPLYGSHNSVEGVLVAASKEQVAEWDLALNVLKALAIRFATEIELARHREATIAQGLRDSLTGLPNRLLFNDRLATALSEAQGAGEMFAVLLVDLDRFKTINDSLGHKVGDQVLLGVAERLTSSVGPTDTVARYAGDEFTIVIRHVSQRSKVEQIAERINRRLSRAITLSNGDPLHITASIGMAFYPEDGASTEQLLKNADFAMYSAKGMGRNNFQAYKEGPEQSNPQKLVLEAKLRTAQVNGELRVFYQPQVNARNEDIVGMEALLRWEHPELGLISPGFFVPLAEETGLILGMGEWVLEKACEETRDWQSRFELPLRLGVNLSALQLKQPELPKRIERILLATGLSPDSLELEVTESINIKRIPNLRQVLMSIRELGCHISIDDFGTGQSSLDYLRRFPADRIKIDQSFVRNIGIDPDDEAIIEATVKMAHNLKRRVIAEGIERETHLSFLRGLGCEELQGYLFCRPLPAGEFEQLLIERQRFIQPFDEGIRG